MGDTDYPDKAPAELPPGQAPSEEPSQPSQEPPGVSPPAPSIDQPGTRAGRDAASGLTEAGAGD